MNAINKINRIVAEKQIGVVLDIRIKGLPVELSVLVDTAEESVLKTQFTHSNGAFGEVMGVYVTSEDAKPPSTLIEEQGKSAYVQFDSVFVTVRLAENGVIIDVYDLDENNENVLDSCFAEYSELLSQAA